ncbi:MAG TPA: glycoside hydrolase family 27 protein [Bryobacteraceae bacterium]|nr:glycoside hydrolase family 27 protein [Bryobacteraceae bacterium]
MHRLVLCGCIFATLAGAADLSGTWQNEQPGRNGQTYVTTCVFKLDGGAITGTYATPQRAYDIDKGTVNGNDFTFQTADGFQTPPRIAEFKGTLNGDQFELTGGGRGGQTARVFKRVSADVVFHPSPELTRTHQPFPPFQAIAPNGFAKTPPMGWNSWNKFAGRVDDKSVREMADAIVSSGMRDAGYIYVNIDDTWEGQRDKDGNITSNEKFPDMKALADYVHSKGLKIGIYSSPGRKTCAGYEASYGHEQQDANTWAAWGFDYLKYDWCSATAVYRPDEMKAAYQKMAVALRHTGRPFVYSLCQYGELNVGEWGAAAGGNLWRTTGDINDTWARMSSIGFDQQIGREVFAGPGHWNDPDMLEIGNGGMNTTEYRTHMSLWCILAAPLLAGHDARTMPDFTRDILLNKEAIAIDQDPAGIQGTRVRKEGPEGATLEVWKKPLEKGVAVGLFNRGPERAQMTVKWSEVGVTSANPKVRDLWAHRDIDNAPTEYTVSVPSHGVVMLRVE